MNNHITNFKEFLKTPFPYMFLALCLFLSSTMLTNASFYTALTNSNNAAGGGYTLCAVCSDPAAKDMLSDLGFTIANFILFPVSALAFLVKGFFPFIFGTYVVLSAIYGILLPFLIFTVYESFDVWIGRRTETPTVYTG